LPPAKKYARTDPIYSLQVELARATKAGDSAAEKASAQKILGIDPSERLSRLVRARWRAIAWWRAHSASVIWEKHEVWGLHVQDWPGDECAEAEVEVLTQALSAEVANLVARPCEQVPAAVGAVAPEIRKRPLFWSMADAALRSSNCHVVGIELSPEPGAAYALAALTIREIDDVSGLRFRFALSPDVALEGPLKGAVESCGREVSCRTTVISRPAAPYTLTISSQSKGRRGDGYQGTMPESGFAEICLTKKLMRVEVGPCK
jgi:hypothetical protein